MKGQFAQSYDELSHFLAEVSRRAARTRFRAPSAIFRLDAGRRKAAAEAMEAEAGDVAADAVERAPEIRDERMGVMEDHGGLVEPLRYVHAQLV